MNRIMMVVCLLVAILAAIMIFIREPGLVLLCARGWVGFAYFRYRIYDAEDTGGHPPVHKPRHRHLPARMPSKHD